MVLLEGKGDATEGRPGTRREFARRVVRMASNPVRGRRCVSLGTQVPLGSDFVLDQ